MVEEYDKEIEDEEEKLTRNVRYDETPPPDIVAFNELRSCADLARLYTSKQLVINPDFQRDVVWSKPSQTRFIDSLVKQLPIPSMCISLDYKSSERLMIDGLQRMSSIINFLTNDSWRLSNLDDIDKRISGRTPGYIRDRYPEIFNRLENLTIPITILRCDYGKKSHMNFLFTIFHRLNTGGNKLSNQEIRNCIYSGTFNELLKSVVKYPNLRALFSLEEKTTYRLAYEELILRIFAYSDTYKEYTGKLAKFLNDYMEDNRNISEENVVQRSSTIERAVDLIYKKILDGKALPRLSKATTEAVFVGIIRNLDELERESDEDLNKRLEILRSNELFSVESLKEGVSAKEKVIRRLDKAVEVFS